MGCKEIRFLLIIFICSIVAPAKAQLTVTPQAGINSAFLSNDLTGVTYDAEIGFQLGVNFRFGGFFYFQPGIYYETFNKSMILELSGLRGDFSNGYINIPILVGLKIVPLTVLDLRLNTGLFYNRLVTVGENDLGLEKDDFVGTTWGWILGLGLDFVFLSVDISYEFGMSNVIDTEFDIIDEIVSSKADILRINLGARL